MWWLAVAGALAADAPEISRSTGQPGGIVVLWPRVIPATNDPALIGVAGALQHRLAGLAASAAAGSPPDVRPMPERVCPRQGCQAVALGAVLYHQQGACVAVVTVSAPGQSPARLAPWAGLVELKAPEVGFRLPPESAVAVKDFVPCTALLSATNAGDAGVTALLAAVRAGG
jgi:hypothetical protein